LYYWPASTVTVRLTVWLPLFASKVTVCVPGARDWVAVSALWLAKLLNGFPVDIHFYLTRRGAFRLKYSGHIYVAGEFNSFSWRAYLPAWLEMRAVCKCITVEESMRSANPSRANN
jgi:hypothetical protein